LLHGGEDLCLIHKVPFNAKFIGVGHVDIGSGAHQEKIIGDGQLFGMAGHGDGNAVDFRRFSTQGQLLISTSNWPLK
jgi:hypothetical protein